jgi:hypothetical protein
MLNPPQSFGLDQVDYQDERRPSPIQEARGEVSAYRENRATVVNIRFGGEVSSLRDDKVRALREVQGMYDNN